MDNQPGGKKTEGGAAGWLHVAKHIPFYLRRVLIIGADRVEFAYYLKKRPGVTVHAVEPDASVAERALPYFDSIDIGSLGSIPGFSTAFDGVIISLNDACWRNLPGIFQAIARVLGPEAPILCFFPPVMPNAPANVLENAFPAFLETAGNAGYHPYRQWNRENTGIFCTGENPPAPLCADATSNDTLLLLTHRDYDPRAHARAYLEMDRPNDCFEVLSMIPPERTGNSEQVAELRIEMLTALQHWARRQPEIGILHFLTKARDVFYAAVAAKPDCAPAYEIMADFWRQAGDMEMAHRLLQAGCPGTARAKDVRQPVNTPPGREETAPVLQTFAQKPRVLFIMTPRAHFGLDVLHDGLCSVLGETQVVEYPWKPTLHGVAPSASKNYPCEFSHGGEPQLFEQVVQSLAGAKFDFVLYGDCEGSLDIRAVRELVRAGDSLPWFLVDQMDEPFDFRPALETRLGVRFSGCFKREMLSCASYGPATFPLPFSYPDGKIPETDFTRSRKTDLFWAGHRRACLRRPYLEHVEKRLERRLDEEYPPAVYAKALLDARIGLNLAGFGFDTVRYWELPAHGTLLLSERLPIRIPYNFEDGKTAAFFSDIIELDEKLTYYLNHPAETAAIAAAGRLHFLAYHTASARARQMLGWIQEIIRR